MTGAAALDGLDVTHGVVQVQQVPGGSVTVGGSGGSCSASLENT